MPRLEENIEVLLVDDDADARNLLRLGLLEAGLRVSVAASGEEALASLADTLPDAVLLDVMMPGIDGFATCGKIREAYEDLPVIFMTGLGESEHIVQGFAVGGTDYVTKPLVIPVVIARLQSHTRVSRLMRATREALGAMDTPMFAQDPDGVLLWCNAAARSLFRNLGVESVVVEGQVLPTSLTEPWRESGEALYPGPLVVPLGSGSVEIRRVTADHENITMCMLKPAAAASVTEWKPPRLTDRESEVLLWVARGKTNRDIGEILGMSPRTVNKHLEHIFEKLGVETRTAAAAAAVRQFSMKQ
jgi:DNA-binding NarL/FixJ family response regulator